MDDPGWGGFTPLPPDGAGPDTVGAHQPAPPSGPRGGAPRPRKPLIIGSVAVAVVAVIAVVVALVAGGGGGGSKAAVATSPATVATTSPTTVAPTTTTTIPATTTTPPGGSLTSAASAYLALEAPAYNSLTAFGQAVAGWKASVPSAAQAQNEANPTVAAFNRLDSELLARTWPTVVQSKIDTLASQVEVVANELGGIRLAFTTGTLSAWATQFTNDGNTLGNDVNAVRAALNLPPIPND
jgi:hypothetical protein